MRRQYNSTATFGPFSSNHKSGALVVKANGGTVTVQADAGNDEWASFLTFDADASQEVVLANNRFRIVPLGGAVYAFTTQ